MSDYRIGVTDTDVSTVTLWYDQETYEDAYRLLVLLRDYARPGVTATIQRREDGVWREAMSFGAAFLPEDDKPYSGTAPIERGPFPPIPWP